MKPFEFEILFCIIFYLLFKCEIILPSAVINTIYFNKYIKSFSFNKIQIEIHRNLFICLFRDFKSLFK